jgi:probable F420-dependent oxidoreductase
MKFGITMFPAHYAIPVDELARAVQDHGFETLLFPEHTHIPVARKSPWPGGPELPKQYYHTLDPFFCLGAAAAVTSTLRIGTGICLVIQRDPITLAKEVASVDFFSGGRFVFGIGFGWNLEEIENHGVDPKSRFGLMRERIAAMKAIWANDEAEFHGQYVDFDPIFSWPKPIQKPNPPIWVGGNGANVLKRVVTYGDEWMPNLRPGPAIETRIGELQELAKQAGRDPIPVTVFGPAPTPEVIENYEAAGVSRIILSLPAAPADEVLPRLAKYAELAKQYGQ